MANFVEIRPENDLPNFVSVHLTKPYSVKMAEPQQTRRHSPPEKQKIGIPHIWHDRQSVGFPGVIRHQTMMTSSNRNIFRVTGPLCGEFTGHRRIPITKASGVLMELWCFLWFVPEVRLSKQSRRRWLETSSRSLRLHCDAYHLLGTKRINSNGLTYFMHQTIIRTNSTGLSPVRHQTVTRANTNLLSIVPLETNFSDI